MSYSKHDCSAKDARRTKFHGRNRYADVSPCKYLVFLNIVLFRIGITTTPNGLYFRTTHVSQYQIGKQVWI